MRSGAGGCIRLSIRNRCGAARGFRVEGARGRSYEGTGIGLALVHDLAKQHGGTVRAESVVDQGSTFVVTIPRGTAHLPPAQIAPESPEATLTRAPLPYLMEAAHWGATSLVAGAAIRNPPDIILSDVMMPRMNGVALLQALRADPRTRTLPFILLSARAAEESIISGLETGADDYLVKPFSTRELMSRVHAHLEMARIRRIATDSATELAETRAALLADLERKNEELEAFSYSAAMHGSSRRRRPSLASSSGCSRPTASGRST